MPTEWPECHWSLIILLTAWSHLHVMTILWGSKARLPYHTSLYGTRWKMATSARPCTRANFRNDATKNRHACKPNPEDSEAVSSTGNTRWQPLKKHHHLRCVQSGETRYVPYALLPCNLLSWIMCEHINANSTWYNPSLVHFKILVAPMSH